MPYCGKCGKMLGDGETCSCSQTPPAAAAEPSAFPNIPRSSSFDPTVDPYVDYKYENDPYKVSSDKTSHAALFTVLFIVVCAFTLIIAFIFIQWYYIRKSSADNVRLDMIAVKAADITESADNVLGELNRMELPLQGLYFISSDENSNAAVPFDVGEFYSRMDIHTQEDVTCQYFIIVLNGKVKYTATAREWTKGKVDTLPDKHGVPVYFTTDDMYNKLNSSTCLDDVYWDAYDKIFRYD
ncbi:MAG: hypothetical protein K6G33_02215 [Ruminococcus sp.]|uniref:hypothetical protein n=1 Tax=Ruminococcus sp. TaxID=41978 RepID=UPI0025D4815A|nr:hypothetical protein [Ruminococcus sp.]MCR5599544.1 hypothetical protein [Ruminococcus sp.]